MGASGAATEGVGGLLSSLFQGKGQPPPLPGATGRGMWEAGQNVTGAGQKVGSFAQDLTDKLQPLNTAIEGTSKAADAAGKAVGTLYKGFMYLPSKILEVEQLITGTAKTWVDAMAAPADTVKTLGDTVSRFTKLSNPAQAQQFQYRIENTFATIGRSVEPIMDALTRSAEKVGDVYAKLSPAITPAAQAIGSIIDTLSDGLEPAARLAAPALRLVAESLKSVALVAKLTMAPSMALYEQVKKFEQANPRLAKMLSPFGGWDPNAKSEVAARTPQYAGVKDIMREINKNSLMAGVGQYNPQVAATDRTTAAVQKLEQTLINMAKDPVGTTVGIAAKFANNPIEAAEDFLGGNTGGLISGSIGAAKDFLP